MKTLSLSNVLKAIKFTVTRDGRMAAGKFNYYEDANQDAVLSNPTSHFMLNGSLSLPSVAYTSNEGIGQGSTVLSLTNGHFGVYIQSGSNITEITLPAPTADVLHRTYLLVNQKSTTVPVKFTSAGNTTTAITLSALPSGTANITTVATLPINSVILQCQRTSRQYSATPTYTWRIISANYAPSVGASQAATSYYGGIFKVNLVRIDSEKLKISEIKKKLKDISGILIPGGFGKRGTDGKIEAIKHARLNKIPFLGICYGMQMAIIEFARNQLNLKNATSSEFDKKGLPIIGLINEWSKDGKMIKGTDKDLGGTMRLGSYDAKLKDNSLIRKIYKSKLIKERHRHRYEVNIAFKEKFEKKGLIFSGLSPDNKLPEIIELKNHPWFIGVQFHPEFKSRPLAPHPLFSSFIKAAKNHK